MEKMNVSAPATVGGNIQQRPSLEDAADTDTFSELSENELLFSFLNPLPQLTPAVPLN
jgi:hypothetical protein